MEGLAGETEDREKEIMGGQNGIQKPHRDDLVAESGETQLYIPAQSPTTSQEAGESLEINGGNFQQGPPTPKRLMRADRRVSCVFENRELIHKFHAKMYRLSKVFVYVHVMLSAIGAIGYSIVSISATNDWQNGIETPGWHIAGGFTANVVLLNALAVAVNLNLCFAALLIIGFHQHNRMMIWMWYLGQLSTELAVTATLVLAVFYECKLTSILSIPPFLYYVVSLSSFRQILATVSFNKSMKV